MDGQIGRATMAEQQGQPSTARMKDPSLEEISGAAKQAAQDAMTKVSDLAGTAAQSAADQAKDLAQEQVRSAADMAGSFAGAVKAAADKLDETSPESATHVRHLGETIDSFARQLHTQSVSELAHGATDYARKQPTAFFAIASLAGFMAARFLKSSTQGAGHVGSNISTTAGDSLGSPMTAHSSSGMSSPGSSPPSSSLPPRGTVPSTGGGRG